MFSDLVKSKRLAWFGQEAWMQEAADLGMEVPKAQDQDVKWNRRTCMILKALKEVNADFGLQRDAQL